MAYKLINYDFSEMTGLLAQIKSGDHSQSTLNDLKDELNRFFKDSKCVGIIYTENDDKMFFGMSVLPMIDPKEANLILQTSDNIRIDKYYIELDSKLFDPLMDLTPDELTACLLHEVGHVVNSREPINDIRKAVSQYLADNDEVLKLSDAVQYQEILAYGIKNSFRKLTSIFEKKDDEILADEFCIACGYGEHLDSLFEKLIKNGRILNKDVENKLVVLTWTLRLYKDVKNRRIAAQRQMRRSISLTASKLDKKEMQNVINRLNRIDDDMLIEAAEIRSKFPLTIRKEVMKNLRDIEEDLYECQLMVKNVENQDEAYTILRKINLNMAVLDDYIHTEEMSTERRKRYHDIYDRYSKLREELVKKDIYDRSSLFIKYPDIKQGRY